MTYRIIDNLKNQVIYKGKGKKLYCFIVVFYYSKTNIEANGSACI